LPFEHDPVLLQAVLDGLIIKPNGVYADGTLGGAGHALSIVQALSDDGILAGIDRDGAAVEAAMERLRPYGSRVKIQRGNFNQITELLTQAGIAAVDGALLDLGVSSHQLDTAGRGFSYRLDGPLDMRMDDREPLSAYEIVNRYSEKHLADILYTYGEERYAKRIARAIVNARPVQTTLQLAGLVETAVPTRPRLGHPAKRTFQAIRIEVNGELKKLDEALRDICKLLKPGGRFCVITFHSLEDRIVKNCFKDLANPCRCPRELPYCVCGQVPEIKIINRKPIVPADDEILNNRRAHSAKLRIAERI
jgi:16S rRNA (cytosine1402-N4)-methyltransferase